MIIKTIFLILAVFVFPVCYGQITDIQKRETVDGILKVLQTRYIFAEVADSMQNFVINNLQSGKYDSITTGSDFAFRLTRDLQQISKDLHLKVEFTKSKQEVENEDSD